MLLSHGGVDADLKCHLTGRTLSNRLQYKALWYAQDAENTAFHLAFNTIADFFSISQERSEIVGAFATYMTVQRKGRPDFTDFFSTNEQLAERFPQRDKDAEDFIDVGGGKAQEV